MKYLIVFLIFCANLTHAEDHEKIQFNDKNQEFAIKELNSKLYQNKLNFYDLSKGDLNKDGVVDFIVLAEVDEGLFSIFVFLGKSDSTYDFYKKSGSLAIDMKLGQSVSIQRNSIYLSRYSQSNVSRGSITYQFSFYKNDLRLIGIEEWSEDNMTEINDKFTSDISGISKNLAGKQKATWKLVKEEKVWGPKTNVEKYQTIEFEKFNEDSDLSIQ